MKHDLDKNWSLDNKIMIEIIFRKLFERPINIQVNNNYILMIEYEHD
jgi:hypothetical protein